MADIRDKKLSRRALARFRAKNRKKTIVFTNGCFDILHRGHVELLREARGFGDLLVVGMNSDASVRRLKGRGRPLVGEKDRAFVLGALEAVDRVVIFDEDTPLETIRALEPDVLVKGSEYRKGEIVGARCIEERGGRVVRVKMRKGFSTTSLIKKIRR
jgi:D-beta-D-heptose 7-phosphate kinase/D-beta-D-heptose 1-phosphate adenosyltransferase